MSYGFCIKKAYSNDYKGCIRSFLEVVMSPYGYQMSVEVNLLFRQEPYVPRRKRIVYTLIEGLEELTVNVFYYTFKAIEAKDPNEQHKWVLYWTVYGSFSVGGIFADRFISWFPLYYHTKLAFLAWLQLPTINGLTSYALSRGLHNCFEDFWEIFTSGY
ncbi:uncharacterized protein LOC128133606 [Lactuca sativa]|uniref:uncharacterized protein LOC128133606 n=1 Tax=Lactuca sativa TaxID=4236 RepID=UPI000CD99C82|nr:uncharacterized protein LOC128133606 [Lactuca sativa]